MDLLLCTPPGQTADDWQRACAQRFPAARLRTWTPGDDAPADYAFVWRAPPAFFAPRAGLRAIFNLGAGVDALLALEHEQPGTLPRDVPLVRLEDTGMGQQMIEYVAHAVLRYLRRFDEYAQLQRESRWQPLPAHARAEFTVGVLGLGVLGAQVARALAALGLPVRGFSQRDKQVDGIAVHTGAVHANDVSTGNAPTSPSRFDAFLDGLHVLVNLLPSTPATDGILNARTFARLKRGAYLVNVGRGAHLVEADLLAALANGQLSAATLDVFAQEPLPAGHPFWREPRITITPHTSAETLHAEALDQIAAKIDALARGEPIGGVIDLARGY
jgi:glyoxylate/hydroxypyruvate reductase